MFILACTTWCYHVAKNIYIQLSPAKSFSNSRSLFLIFGNWCLCSVLDPHKHNSAPLSIANNTSVFIHAIIAAYLGLSFLGWYKFSQSAMISVTFVCHSTCCGKDKWRKCPMLYLHYPWWILPLLLCFVLLVDLLWQGSYGSWKTWKVMEFWKIIFQAWKVMDFSIRSWKILILVMENE